MRIQLSWLCELVPQLEDRSAEDVADLLNGLGIEVDEIGGTGPADINGLYVGEVVDIHELTEFKKPIRYCQVRFDDGSDPERTRGIVCGATNFAVGDKVVAALPGAVLPGDFQITARKTYGKVSDGMICSASEMGLGEDHAGILVLPQDSPVGADAVGLLGLHDVVLVTEPTPDRGYQLSLRGMARELAAALGVPFTDPAYAVAPAEAGDGFPVTLQDRACDVFTTRIIRGFDPDAATPDWMARRLTASGMRPISLAVDITNYVMLLLGQPLHAYDLDKLRGKIIVRKAVHGETVTTLDDVTRALSTDDLLITDESGIQGIAGVMGAEYAEISSSTANIMLEAAHFDPSTISRTARRHGLLSEAGRRFERGVDPLLPGPASALAVQLLTEYGGGTADETMVSVGGPALPAPLTVDVPRLRALIGVDYPLERITTCLALVGCQVDGGDTLTVHPPSWRPDFLEPTRAAEEVARIDGYDKIPSRLPQAKAGGGLTGAQRAERRAGRTLAAAGFVETPSMSFQDDTQLDRLGIGADDERRRSVKVANPISAEQRTMRTTLLPNLLAALRRNVSRGADYLTTYELGTVFFEPAQPRPAAPVIDRGIHPAPEQLAALEMARPIERLHAAVAVTGTMPAAWYGEGEQAGWRAAVEAVRLLADAVGTRIDVRQARQEPWHPGRCAAVVVGATGAVIGYAGELHPQVCEQLGLPARTSVAEIDLSELIAARSTEATAPRVSPFPRAVQDLAVVADADIPVASLQQTIRTAGGELLEEVRLFDVYTGEQVGSGKRSLAFTLALRADDRTLEHEEITAVREGIISALREEHGAVLR